MEVVSCIDGRIRLRHDGLRQPPLAEAVSSKLRSLPEIRSVKANSRTGSLLVVYDRIKATLRKVLSALADLLGLSSRRDPSAAEVRTADKAARPYFSRRRVVNLGMLFSLLVSIGGAMAGTEAMHIAVGVLFVALVGIHISDKIRPLFT